MKAINNWFVWFLVILIGTTVVLILGFANSSGTAPEQHEQNSGKSSPQPTHTFRPITHTPHPTLKPIDDMATARGCVEDIPDNLKHKLESMETPSLVHYAANLGPGRVSLVVDQWTDKDLPELICENPEFWLAVRELMSRCNDDDDCEKYWLKELEDRIPLFGS